MSFIHMLTIKSGVCIGSLAREACRLLCLANWTPPQISGCGRFGYSEVAETKIYHGLLEIFCVLASYCSSFVFAITFRLSMVK